MSDLGSKEGKIEKTKAQFKAIHLKIIKVPYVVSGWKWLLRQWPLIAILLLITIYYAYPSAPSVYLWKIYERISSYLKTLLYDSWFISIPCLLVLFTVICRTIYSFIDKWHIKSACQNVKKADDFFKDAKCVMLHGVWGEGKTHYYDNSLKRVVRPAWSISSGWNPRHSL